MRHETSNDNMKVSTEYNSMPQTTNNCIVNLHTTNSKQDNEFGNGQ